MKALVNKAFILLTILLSLSLHSFAQGDAKADAKIDAARILIGDQARLFIEVQHDPKLGRVLWPTIPDTFNHLEIVEKGKIDTSQQGTIVTYKQRLLITGFDSGLYRIPSIAFTIQPNSGTPYMVQTDSMLSLLVQTVPVDTTKGFKGIKDIKQVKTSWLDYTLYIGGGALFVVLLIVVIIYFLRNRKTKPVLVHRQPEETLQERTLRLLSNLEQEQLWQQNQVKEYYSYLTDIVRTYIEQRFRTPAMELTTDELLHKANMHKDMVPHAALLESILMMADLAKFAKAQPTAMEHVTAMENAKQFVITSTPNVYENN